MPDQHLSWRPGHVLVAIPVGLILVITVLELVVPWEVRLTPLLVTAPAITASFAGPRLTAVIGALAVVDHLLLDVVDDLIGTLVMRAELLALIVVTAFLVLFSFIRDRHREELTRVRSVSEAAQHALLRPLPPRIGPLEVACVYLAAEEEAQIGGDLYAGVRVATGTRLVIGDVRGKGMPSVSDATVFLGAFREAARRRATLPQVVGHLEESVAAEYAERAADCSEVIENFITAAVLEVPDDLPVLKMINCGHPPPLLVRSHEVTFLAVARPTVPLGLGELAHAECQVATFAFEAGDTLLLYTDGVVEARDPDGVFYPLAERMAKWQGDGPRALVEYVRADLLAYVGGRLGDDAAMVALQRVSY
ncbi:PP2C family protein-serine/threonine phosphatase [Sphaerisporangium aureirubrum]|uniref:PP2C family protein-serine/threonine phosphatase n=1 Tax=Sphaerisporangium aureirubrum TaxID=1544736 RepID=A0ABW1NLZ7_9ACTN